MKVFRYIPFLVLFVVISSQAANFLSDGGTFVTINRNGMDTRFQMSYSSGGEPEFNGTDLGIFSTVDGSTLVLNGFENVTVESPTTSIFLGRFCHCVSPYGDSTGRFTTNINTSWATISGYVESHFSTNMGINLLQGLAPGTYQIEVYSMAGGNFSPELVENNNGSNYIARFTITDEPAPIPADATEDGKWVLDFSFMTNTIVGEEVFVVGNHPDIGNWNPLNARKLHWTDGNIWTGSIAVTEGTTIEYKFIIRTNTAAEYANSDNTIWMSGDNRRASTGMLPGEPGTAKTVYYYSSWTNASLVYQCGSDTNWYTTPMSAVGTGRTGGEYLYALENIGKTGERIEFVIFSDDGGVEHWDKFPGDSNYYTHLDTFLLQDQAVYSYWPPIAASASTIHTTAITSAYAPTIPSRDIRIYLPRNYTNNPAKSYPVLYMHDGQNVFAPGGTYGCWNAETTADEMINRGEMRETIIVAVNNSGEREREYVPPTDNAGFGTGTADQYLLFLVNDVKSYVDSTYRTRTDEANTLTLGSSLGGLVSMYLGTMTNVFGKVGPMSPSFWAATNFVSDEIADGDPSGLRIYMDCGTEEGTSMWDPAWNVYNYLQIDGYVVNDSLCMNIGCGQEHNEAAWAARLPVAYTFLLNARDEANLIAAEDNPPQLVSPANNNDQFTTGFIGSKGISYQLQRTQSLETPSWTTVSTGTQDQVMWPYISVTDTNATGENSYYRILFTDDQ